MTDHQPTDVPVTDSLEERVAKLERAMVKLNLITTIDQNLMQIYQERLIILEKATGLIT